MSDKDVPPAGPSGIARGSQRAGDLPESQVVYNPMKGALTDSEQPSVTIDDVCTVSHGPASADSDGEASSIPLDGPEIVTGINPAASEEFSDRCASPLFKCQAHVHVRIRSGAKAAISAGWSQSASLPLQTKSRTEVRKEKVPRSKGCWSRAEEAQLLQGWRHANQTPSLAEAHNTVSYPKPGSRWFAKMAAFFGVGFMVSTGYSDPGKTLVAASCTA